MKKEEEKGPEWPLMSEGVEHTTLCTSWGGQPTPGVVLRTQPYALYPRMAYRSDGGRRPEEENVRNVKGEGEDVSRTET